jgi:CBS domain-containing protein
MSAPTVRDAMDRETHAISPDLPILEAVSRLIDTGVTGVPVVDAAGAVLGVLSEEHCLKLMAAGDENADAPQGTVAEYYDASVPRVRPDMNVHYVAGMFMRSPQHRRFPVVEDGKLVGVLTRKDILRTLRTVLA